MNEIAQGIRLLKFCLIAVVGLSVSASSAAGRSRSFANSRAQNTAPRSGWQTLTNCRYVTNGSNDGDSFHVTASGKQYLFRLYFVDTPETDASLNDRIDEQAKYFGITFEQTIKVGKVAQQYTREKLTQPFTVRTCFQDALGRSKMERFYAIVQTTTGDLGEQLIENGLARIHGASANPVGLPRADVEWQKLQQLERNAKQEKVGGWGAKFGRMLARSQLSTNRAPVDPFDAFFHPERVKSELAMPSPSPSGSAWPFPKLTPTVAPVVARSTSTPAPSASTITSTSLRDATAEQASKLDINTASEEEIEKIPGIGPTLAGRIIAARPFKSADDLRQVKGIGDARYEKLRPYFD